MVSDSRVDGGALRRFAFERKGYDCRHGEWQHPQKGHHGINGGSWIFAVSSGDRAVSIHICTSFFPETVPLGHRNSGWPAVKSIITGVLNIHCADPNGEECDFVDGGRCQSGGESFLVCDEFASVLGETFDPQPEAFWLKLAERLTPHASETTEESASKENH